jgi:hypothetical protein
MNRKNIMNIQKAVDHRVGTIIERISDPYRKYRIGDRILESINSDGSRSASAMRIDDLSADDWTLVGLDSEIF